ncbi:MAG: glycosyl hydrolase [Gemmatimonadetes bacterium]|nr:glycosyl hydrolase [Gemmatimonadota bacterium]
MRSNRLACLPFLLTLGGALSGTLSCTLAAQSAPDVAKAANALTLRSIGPALASGRIADIAVHPTNRSTWYVAAGSGGLWKTTNAGMTFTPVFDDQPSYSIGVVTLDPNNPEVVWVGTGENVSGRHVGWGDGIYRSRDAGRTWQQMGLAASQHIGKILIDPRNSDVMLVAAEGPLWSAGGERGVYRSEDGGRTWTATLTIDENTGVTDIEFAPGDPNTIYAAAYQRRRHVAGFLAGGPRSGIHKSTDGGKTWRRITTGLPGGDMGKIGIAVTAADPTIVYATIEASNEERGFYRSRDRGESWEKRNSYISGGTGPHYYQEIEASPTDANVVYQMDVFVNVTRDGGATFNVLETGHTKHSDNHALWIDPTNTDHLLVGTDAGLYESFDDGREFRHFPNLPISQFYKVALSNREPFYDILGGAQDLGTLHGPSRTLNRDGIRNQDWYVPMGADGYGVGFDPRDENITYLMTQQGDLYRTDRRSDEALGIRPMPAEGDAPERWNWDSPIIVSPHSADRIYFASQRLWRSEDRGNSWTAISGDLTQGTNRYTLSYMGRVWSVTDLHDNGAMSKYATITAVSESPVTSGVLIVGTDDGLVQLSSDAGRTWTRASALPGLPPFSFINDVEASLTDANTFYVAADAHKTGDFTPYVYVTTDRGRTWRSIAGDLPKNTIVWTFQQDHVRSDLLFLGTEFGIQWSPNGGRNWHKLSGGVPTISFRDLKIHRRDNDLVGATFGRGFYILDDLTPLRAIAAGVLASEGAVLPVRDAWWFIPSAVAQAPGRPTLGSDDFTSPNPPHGALFTYWLREVPTTAREARLNAERAARETGRDVPFPGYDQLRAEPLESGPRVFLQVSDAAGRAVRRIEGRASAGMHRINWDLRGPVPGAIDLSTPGFRPPWAGDPVGPLMAPGRYSVELVLVSSSGVRRLGEAQSFTVKPAPNALPGTDYVAVAAFQQETSDLMRRMNGVGAELGRVRDRVRHMRAALAQAPRASPALQLRMDSLIVKVAALEVRLIGDPARQQLNETSAPGLRNRLGEVIGGHWDTRMAPTATHRENFAIARAGFDAMSSEVAALISGELARLETELETAGAPWTPGRPVPPS